MSKKVIKKETIVIKTKEEACLDALKAKSMSIGSGVFATGAHRNRKKDKKIRRNEGKKMCRNLDNF